MRPSNSAKGKEAEPKYDTSFSTSRTRTANASARGTSTRRKDPSSAVIIAISENRLKEIGMAGMDLHRPECWMSQFCDNVGYNLTIAKLCIHDPIEVLLPKTAVGSELKRVIEKNFPDTEVVLVARKYFSETSGMSYIKQFVSKEYSSVELSAASKYLSVASTAALIKYVEFMQKMSFAPESMKIVYQAVEGTMMIDAPSIANLELIRNQRSGNANNTLYETAVGARLLRINLLQPPSNIPTINTRLDCVEELIDNEKMFFKVLEALAQFLDLDSLLLQLVKIPKNPTLQTSRAALNGIIYLKHTLSALPKVVSALSGCHNSLLRAVQSNLGHPNLQEISDQIARVVNEGTGYSKSALQMRTQQAFAIKPGINGLLDVARKTWTEATEDIHNIAKHYRDQLGLVALRLEYNARRGYYLSLPISSGKPPSCFIQVSKKGKKWLCSSKELISYNARLSESMNEILLMTDRIIEDLLNKIRKHIGCLFKVSESIALLDMLASFATYVSVSQTCVRPEFTDSGPLAIKQGRHPIAEKIYSDPFIPNDSYMTEASNVAIVTGPNMSGKSTYLRQVALLTIVAHIGCYVPASFASFRLVDRLFTRIGTGDNMETNSSTFMVEMRETAFIVQNATDRSLIIVDELGRATTYLDGLSIAWAVSEYLLSMECYAIIATHFNVLTGLASLYPNVKNYHLQVEHTPTHPKFMYTLVEGPTNENKYGIEMARIAGLPTEVISMAKAMQGTLEMNNLNFHHSEAASQDAQTTFQLAQRLLHLKTSTLDAELLRKYLQDLKNRFVNSASMTASIRSPTICNSLPDVGADVSVGNDDGGKATGKLVAEE
ncbi:MutS protein msh4 [Balamuthia mandrillaris]